jgi:hypothetical protein
MHYASCLTAVSCERARAERRQISESDDDDEEQGLSPLLAIVPMCIQSILIDVLHSNRRDGHGLRWMMVYPAVQKPSEI